MMSSNDAAEEQQAGAGDVFAPFYFFSRSFRLSFDYRWIALVASAVALAVAAGTHRVGGWRRGCDGG